MCSRFTSWHHPCGSAGGCADLCPAGRCDVVRVQEECVTFSRLSHPWQCLLQTNQLTGHGVRRKRSDYGPGGPLGRIALVDSFEVSVALLRLRLSLTISPSAWSCKHCKAAAPTPQDGGGMMAANTSLFSLCLEDPWCWQEFSIFQVILMRIMSVKIFLMLSPHFEFWGVKECPRRDAREL